MSEGRRGGERRRLTLSKRRHRTQAREIASLRHGTRPSLGPFDPCALILTMLLRRKAGRWGALGDIAAGQTCASRRNRHRGRRKQTSRGSPRITAPQGEAWCVRKGRRSRPSSLRGSGARVWLPARRRNAVAEVVRRRLASNKLGKRAAKTAAGSSERGSSSNRAAAGETGVERNERRVCRDSASPL